MLFCAASNRAVMEQILADYRRETGRRIEVQYGPSQTLLVQLEASRTGDLYLPADDSYLDLGRCKELIATTIPIARMQAVVAVRKGNPLAVRNFADLLRSEIRLIQANPDTAAIGKVTREVLQAAGQWKPLDSATTAYRTTVTETANDVLVGAADAGIVYDAVLHSYPDLEAIEIPELEDAKSDVAVGLVTFSTQTDQALQLARYLAARDHGQRHYRDHGFDVIDREKSTRPETELGTGHDHR